MNGWENSTTWRGVFAIDLEIGDGTQTFRVADAVDSGGFPLADDTRFQFEIDFSGVIVVHNGIVQLVQVNRVELSWNAEPITGSAPPLSSTEALANTISATSDGSLAGVGSDTEAFDVLRSPNGLPGAYEKVNTVPITNPGSGSVGFSDTTVDPSSVYFYSIYSVDGMGNSLPYSGLLVAVSPVPVELSSFSLE